MWLSITLLLFVTFQHSASIKIYDEGNIEFRSHADFVDKIRNWFKNLKDRLVGTRSESTTEISEREFLDIDKAALERRVQDAGGFFVDLPNLSFDPRYDIGFRIGHWYFIRRGDRDVSQYESDEDSREFFTSSLYKDSESALPPLTTEVRTTETEIILQTSSIENYSHETSKTDRDNENESKFNHPIASVEVLIPR